ncbi:MAG: hypothetical protein MUE83_05700 [Tabrizicola sp.]|nr:hypothetical protein [Tabrizicola sp.]
MLNLGFSWVEIPAALRIGSVAPIADSTDVLEDAAINTLIFCAHAWTATRRGGSGPGLTPEFAKPPNRSLQRLRHDFFEEIVPLQASRAQI